MKVTRQKRTVLTRKEMLDHCRVILTSSKLDLEMLTKAGAVSPDVRISIRDRISAKLNWCRQTMDYLKLSTGFR